MNVSRKKLEDILKTLYSIECQFFACDGPDMPFVDMATCNRCSAIQDLEKILEEKDQ